MQQYDTIVVGVGGVGSAATASLARRGNRVLGIDRFRPPHARGSSHGETRVIRQAYFEHADYVPLLRHTYDLWRELESRQEVTLFQQCGLLEVGPHDGEVVPGVLKAASEHQLPVETLSAREAATRWPALAIPDGLDVVYEPTAGYLRVEQCVTAMLADAKEHGAQLVTDCEVLGWDASEDGVEVRTTEGVYKAASMVISAGAWSGQLLAALGIPLTLLRKSLFWFESPGAAEAPALPVFLFELGYGVPYGFPSLDGKRLKVAVHSGGTPIADPSLLDDAVDANEQQIVDRFLSECLPAIAGPPVDMATCMYTMTPDGHFVIDRHPEHANVVIAVGFSGHGFKFVPVLGEALADLAMTGSTPLPIEFLSLARFATEF